LAEIQLLEPADTIKNTTPSFKWQPRTELKNATYSLKIVELKSGQVPIEAISKNQPVWTVSGIKELSTRYPIGKPALDSSKTYVWTVEAKGTDGAIKGEAAPKWLKIEKVTLGVYPNCLCGIFLTEPQTIFCKSQHDASFAMQPYQYFIDNCRDYGSYWRDDKNNLVAGTGPFGITPKDLTLGIHIYQYMIKNTKTNDIYCSQKYSVFIFP